MSYKDRIELLLHSGLAARNYDTGFHAARTKVSSVAAEADAEIARLKAEIARRLEYEASNKRSLEAYLSGEPSRPPVTGRRKTLAGEPPLPENP
jgi:hypothetical protein